MWMMTMTTATANRILPPHSSIHPPPFHPSFLADGRAAAMGRVPCAEFLALKQVSRIR